VLRRPPRVLGGAACFLSATQPGELRRGIRLPGIGDADELSIASPPAAHRSLGGVAAMPSAERNREDGRPVAVVLFGRSDIGGHAAGARRQRGVDGPHDPNSGWSGWRRRMVSRFFPRTRQSVPHQDQLSVEAGAEFIGDVLVEACFVFADGILDSLVGSSSRTCGLALESSSFNDIDTGWCAARTLPPQL
jgi:hypothetical protein